MVFRKIHDLIPAVSLLKLLAGVSVVIQLIVIAYSHLTGYYTVMGFDDLLTKLAMGVSLTFFATILVGYPDLLAIRTFNHSLPWNERPVPRIVIQFLFSLISAAIVSTGITLISHAINSYVEPLREVLINNALIFAVCNVIIMITFEAWIFFIDRAKTQKLAVALEKEMSQIRFEVLKTQINPHFMFNSLNVLSGLIENDTQKAQRFIDEFSQIYRYVLETIDQYLVSLDDELRFARSYMFLQQIRYGKHLKFSVDLPADLLRRYLPPLSLQVVLENAIKHNLVSSEQPLQINITEKDQKLMVTNNLQPKVTHEPTTGIGQKNLEKRFLMVSNQKPEFRLGTSQYVALLPLIEEEKDEYSNY